MRKPRDDSAWNPLSAEQRDMLEEWLFDEQLGYAEVLVRAQKEFGLEGTRASLDRYYRRRAREREVLDLLPTKNLSDAINEFPLEVDNLRKSALKMVGKAALRVATERPDGVRELEGLTKLLLASEDIELRRARLNLAERCFQYEAAVAARKDLPNLAAFMTELWENPNLTEEQRT